ncbi:MAG: hypothetical protein ACFFDF_17075 [Candidatus Odinarchaeota archaeon]
MTIVKDIIDLLETKEMTTAEVATKLKIKVANCSSYLNTLMNDRRITRIPDKMPFTYTTPKLLLKQLYEFMSNEEKCILKDIDESDINLFETIKEVIK